MLGAGGMGTVYEAEAPGTGTRVAVKLLSSRLASNPTSVERFRQEGRLASQLAHPRCVFVLSADTDDGRPYIVMELMPGRTLKDLVDERGPLAPEEAISRVLDVIDGLAEAHRVGMIHRDVKPSNCFLTADDRVKVGDFGLSKSLAGGRDHQPHADRRVPRHGAVRLAGADSRRAARLRFRRLFGRGDAVLPAVRRSAVPPRERDGGAGEGRLRTAAAIREKRQDVSARLERIIMKGLERDRAAAGNRSTTCAKRCAICSPSGSARRARGR